MAFADGGPLVIPDDAPKTLTDALLAAAERFPEKGIHFVRADGSESFLSYPDLVTEAKQQPAERAFHRRRRSKPAW